MRYLYHGNNPLLWIKYMAILAGWHRDSNQGTKGGILRVYIWRQRGSYEHMVHAARCSCCCMFLDEFKRHSRLKSLLFHFEFCRKRDLFVWQRALDYHYFHIWVKYSESEPFSVYLFTVANWSPRVIGFMDASKISVQILPLLCTFIWEFVSPYT